MTKVLSIILALTMCLSLCACDLSGSANLKDQSPSSEDQLHAIGLDAIAELKYLIENKDFSKFIDGLYTSVDFKNVRDSISTKDYDTPIAIYSIKGPSFEELMTLDENFDNTLWDNLPKRIKDIFVKRYSSSNIHHTINNEGGPADVSVGVFTSVYFASKEYESLSIEEQEIYLYIFENGTPVMVYFNSSNYVTAYLLIADCDFEDLSEKKLF